MTHSNGKDHMRRNSGLTVLKICLGAWLTMLSACGGGGGSGGNNAPPENWLIMVYMADDNNLESNTILNINQLEYAPPSQYVTTVLQVDTETVNINGSTTAKRLLIQPEGVANMTIVSPTVEDLGEIDSGSISVIKDFVVWATSTYPADRYVLIFEDHGGQWKGYGSDDTSGTGLIEYSDLNNMFSTIQSSTGISKFDIVGFDACLMGSIEIAQLLEPYASYLVASAELVTSPGWGYGDAIKDLTINPGMGVPGFAKVLCDRFIEAANYHENTNQTLSAIDLGKVNVLISSIDSFAQQLISNVGTQLNTAIAPARRYSPGYGENSPGEISDIIDLDSFAYLVSAFSSVPSLQSAANDVMSKLDGAVAYRVQGVDAPDHGGLSIYFPNHSNSDPTAQANYISEVNLPLSTQWDEFFQSYQSGLNSDTTPPSIAITSVSNTVVTAAIPVSIYFSLSGSDIYRPRGKLYWHISSTTVVEYGDINYGAPSEGNFLTTWDGRGFALSDGTSGAWFGGQSISPLNNLHISFVNHTPAGGLTSGVFAYSKLDWASGTGSILGFYRVTLSGILESVTVNPGDAIEPVLPIHDQNAGAYIGYQPGVTLTVPSGGYSVMTFYLADLPVGYYDYIIIAEDYAENESSAFVTLLKQ